MPEPKCHCGEAPYFPAKVRAEVNGYERVISLMAGYVCTLSGGSSHGRHGMGMIFLLKTADFRLPHQRELHGIRGFAEDHQERVARGFNLFALLEIAQDFSDQSMMPLDESTRLAIAQLLLELGGTDDVGEQDRGQLPLFGNVVGHSS